MRGFDPLVFQGSLRRPNYGCPDRERGVFVAQGMEEYCWQNQIVFKDYQDRVQRVSEQRKEQSLQPFREQKLPGIFRRDPQADQEAKKNGIESGLGYGISTLEPSPRLDHPAKNILGRIRPAHLL